MLRMKLVMRMGWNLVAVNATKLLNLKLKTKHVDQFRKTKETNLTA
jgi:hypothetical protein